ncbi:hypothetical protein [Enterococcus raffinosus]|uniref:Uncharacterized protein n=1 Tax=Enterococcus raffinosus TaxID=71452 RepID=A0AAW8T7V0_9ENTE|nr:hypothetical protein [Enterococcus raffinosus]MDT2525019.1 hypothetical protein [Enterococcus raffinosus]MDT2531487.1 hypothetical protein [Enterococcus raffinosus]MDT2532863.1 hypothetical protein [Enterococcus raffinosus]MDT2543950.1 hypothetical protein [Enterococcus raffinosus]MDT2556535.1 hypothetical protein [Enterococcus raffinosus]
MKKMVFFDLDGTLCSGGSLQVGQEIITAFNDLKEMMSYRLSLQVAVVMK